jgi:hypothetical protein
MGNCGEFRRAFIGGPVAMTLAAQPYLDPPISRRQLRPQIEKQSKTGVQPADLYGGHS